MSITCRVKKNLSHNPEKAQECLEAYAHDIEAEGGIEKYKQNHNLKNPIGWFYNAMKSAGGYVSTTGNFISEEERVNQTMQELLKKKRILREKNQQKLEALAFAEWMEQTPKKEIEKLVPAGFMDFMEGIHEDMVKSHFVKNEMEGFLKGLR